MPRLGPATRNIAIGRLQAEESQNEVARTLNVNQSTIPRLWNRFQQTVSTNDHQSSGRPRITTPGEDQYIRVFHLRNRTVAASAIAAGIPGLRRISSQTVRNRLWQHGIRPRRPYSGAVLTPLHRNVMAEYVYIGAGLNVPLPLVFRKWISSVDVVSWCGRLSQMTAKQT
jgi:transposase